MYDVSKSMYPLSVIQFHQLVKTVFVLNGAYCHINNSNSPTVPKGVLPPEINSGGLMYTTHGSVSSVTVPTIVTPLTEENLVVHFTFYQKFEPTLVEDVHGKIFMKNGRYILHIMNATKVLDVIGHDDVVLTLTMQGPLTIEKLRDVLGKVRTFYFLEALDKLNDVLPVPSKQTELDDIMKAIAKYIKMSVDSGYTLAMCTDTLNEKTEGKILHLRLRKSDGSKSEKSVVTITLHPRKYEPSIILKTMFENDTDPFTSVFKILRSPTDLPFKIEKIISPKETDYFVKEIMKAHYEIKDYKFIKKENKK